MMRPTDHLISSDDAQALPKSPSAMAGKPHRGSGEVDMTPMVDVTFLLLIFFMVTASFTLQKSIAMPPQQSEQASWRVQDEPELEPVRLEVDRYGAFRLLTAESELETPGKQRLVAALKDAASAGGPDAKLDIRVHEDTKLRWLVDAMDAGTIAGFGELTVTQYDDR